MASHVLAELAVPKPDAGKVCQCCVPDPVVFRFITGFAFTLRLRGCAAAQCVDTASSKACGALTMCAHVA